MKLRIATFAGGCFWCTEAVFQNVKGVTRVTPGYSGGESKNPTYKEIHSEYSKHAECVQIEYNPEIVSFEILVHIFFGTHDPTQINGQGNDIGKEYRSIIFYHNEEQRETAEKVKNALADSGIYEHPVTTSIEPSTTFFEAEPEHKNFYEQNPNQPYCQVVIDPKIAKFRKQFQTISTLNTA